MKILKRILLLLLVIVSAFAAYLMVNIRTIEVEQLSDDLFVLRGVGGNTTVLNTDQGTVIVDSMTFKMQGNLIRKKAEELTGKDTILLINTHYHFDHTHGNPAFDPSTEVVATERTLSHMQVLDAGFWKGDAGKLLPNTTFSKSKTFNLGNKTVVVSHLGRGHTDGDLIVYIPEENTIALGDLFFHRHYPNIDLEAGGSVAEWPVTLDKIMQLGAEQYIPGHGATSGVAAVQEFRLFMQQLADIGAQAAADNSSLEQVQASDAFTADKEFHPIVWAGIPMPLDRNFVLRRAWEEATGNFELKN